MKLINHMLHSTKRRDRQLNNSSSEAVLLRKQTSHIARIYGIFAILLIVIALGATNLLANIQQTLALPSKAPLAQAPSEINVINPFSEDVVTDTIDAGIDQRMGVFEDTHSLSTTTAESKFTDFFRDDVEDLVREGTKLQERYIVPGGPFETVAPASMESRYGGGGGFDIDKTGNAES